MKHVTPRVFLFLALSACATPTAGPPPAPTQLAVPLPPSEAIQRAARLLTLEGFTIGVSDANGGILTATLEKRGKGDWGPLVTCRLGPDAIGRVDAIMTLTARVAASPQLNGASTVVVAAEAVTRFGPNSFGARMGLPASTTTDCISSGETEKRIAAALSAP